MRRGVLFAAMLTLGAQLMFAQTQRFDIASPRPDSGLFLPGFSAPSLLSYDTVDVPVRHEEHLAITHRLQIQGPVVHVLKAKGFWAFPKRLFSLLNPFRPRKHRGEIRVKGVGRLSTRSWTAIAGWNPGQSAFPDATTSSFGLTLISLNRASP
jgi:hypothetical protein